MSSMVQELMKFITPVYPEVILITVGLTVLVFDFFIEKERKSYLGWFSLAGVIIAAVATYNMMGTSGIFFSGTYLLDPFSLFFKFVFYIACGLGILLSINYLKVENIHRGEYYALMLFATSGMMLMASAGDLITLYLGLELMALSIYILAGFMRRDNRSNEAAIKYLVLGAFSSGIMLYGMSLLYGLTGTTNLAGILAFLQKADLANPVLFLAMIMLIVSFGFKVAAVPFHMWTPDVYEGAPTPVTAFMSAGAKGAGFAAILRIFTEAAGPLSDSWTGLLWVLAALTMTVGNVAALTQSNIKRMLAYSSIAHAGYILMGVLAGTQSAYAAILFYILAYTFMKVGAFAIVEYLESNDKEMTDISG